MPEGPGPFPVVLYAHGGGSGSRHYFLEDAVALARDGYAGLLITGPDSRPPYLPIGTTWDARMDIGGTVQFTVDLRRGIDLLETLPEIDAGRIGFVGYSAGAWPGAYLAGVEDRIDAFVLQSLNGWPCAGSASTTSCHVLDLFGYSDLPPQQDLERYLEDTMVLNPVPYVGHAEAAFLFQASRSDRWESIPTIRAVYEAASGPKVLRWYEGGHRLGCLGLLGPTLSCAAHSEAFVFHRAWLEEHV
jgi:dienelactone hydrolase